MMRRHFMKLFAAVGLIPAACKKSESWPAYPEKFINGRFTTDQYDVLAWQIQMRRKLSQYVPETGFSTCGSCNLPWWVVQGHDVKFEDTGGCFPICEQCFNALGANGSLPFYEAWVRKNYGEDTAKLERIRQELFKASTWKVLPCRPGSAVPQ